MIYCYPKLSKLDFIFFRLLGPGLGNLLFPWARALVHAKKNGYQLITPTWPQVKVGTLLRQELDSRMYSDLFKHHQSDISGAKRAFKLLTAKRISEVSADYAKNEEIIEFCGMDSMFMTILDDHQTIKSHLIEMTRPQHLEGLEFDFHRSISVHVRLGDFSSPKTASALASGETNTRIPIEWYASIVNGIRAAHNEIFPVYIFSDGTDDELSTLTSLPQCRRISFGSSIADMLALSNAHILVASGSTFSMWASFLGRMPVIWHPGQMKQKMYRNEVFEKEVETGSAFHSTDFALNHD